jgi:predicted DNA-binding transcriptional regulator AlpA
MGLMWTHAPAAEGPPQTLDTRWQRCSPMRYLSDKQLAERFGITRATVWRWARSADFPKPVSLSPGCTRWRLAEIKDWEAARSAAA